MGYQADRPMLRREKLKVAFPLIATTKKLCDDLTTEVGETGKTLVINSIKKKKKRFYLMKSSPHRKKYKNRVWCKACLL